MRVLGIDTAGPMLGAALLDGDAPARSWSARGGRGSDAVLAPAIASLLREVDDIDLIAVSVGPGGFTALRVGVASALGVALARRRPVVPVSSLEARAALAPEAERVLALLDARKGRAYAGLFAPELVGEEQDLPPEQAVALAAGAPFVATGEGALVWSALIEAAGGQVHPRAAEAPAAELARIGRDRAHAALAPEAIRLHYIRPSDAQPPRR
ncbi:MAG: tRNA (adenosine(37)-N6)-threonylcarbamoyltransferase complex dimerization subunit type 1 TsaB [Alphaproteobacteria bacterium]|nr:tRNA (adenosine(37)-N6)-threonylcarbamoyltransferase complex dimerization subunit type 1 TsaB [Alphaproteobacteria bacterium]MCB9792552.1 tRNA (adenosine(37)-N6)-threonylcarbamoyltransferase complex dimerization subunit type 1 TsaB [Alphaproteobacteria bacterium]